MSSRRITKDKKNFSLNDKVLTEIVDETGFTKTKINYCISHFFKWQVEQLNNNPNCNSFLIQYFTTITPIEERLKQYNNEQQDR